MSWRDQWHEHQELLDWFEGYLSALEERNAPTKNAYFHYELLLILGPTQELVEGLTVAQKMVTKYQT